MQVSPKTYLSLHWLQAVFCIKDNNLSANTCELLAKRKLNWKPTWLQSKSFALYCWSQHILKGATFTFCFLLVPQSSSSFQTSLQLPCKHWVTTAEGHKLKRVSQLIKLFQIFVLLWMCSVQATKVTARSFWPTGQGITSSNQSGNKWFSSVQWLPECCGSVSRLAWTEPITLTSPTE